MGTVQDISQISYLTSRSQVLQKSACSRDPIAQNASYNVEHDTLPLIDHEGESHITQTPHRLLTQLYLFIKSNVVLCYLRTTLTKKENSFMRKLYGNKRSDKKVCHFICVLACDCLFSQQILPTCHPKLYNEAYGIMLNQLYRGKSSFF